MILPFSPSSMLILKRGSSRLWGRMCDIDVEGAKSKKGNAIFETNFLSHIFFEFLVFVAIVGKISSSSSQSRRKNSKIHWCGLFLAGRKCPGYLARARARARALGPRVALGPLALLTIGDYAQRLFARAQLWCFFCIARFSAIFSNLCRGSRSRAWTKTFF